MPAAVALMHRWKFWLPRWRARRLSVQRSLSREAGGVEADACATRITVRATAQVHGRAGDARVVPLAANDGRFTPSIWALWRATMVAFIRRNERPMVPTSSVALRSMRSAPNRP